jgi:ATP-dependent helicase/nuclease subunit A
MLFTATGELRKSGGVTKAAGFPLANDNDFTDITPATRTEGKQRMKALLDALVNEPNFLRALGKTQHLPTSAAIKDHAPLLQATLTVLRQAAIHLMVLLRERGVTDFSGVADAAVQVLTEAREDVMAGLDARLKHVLVDEVQDTNPAQFALLSSLIVDWSAGDGRTLFLVGDPMQSIYGFRDADVGLFAQAKDRGVSDVRLAPLTLSANYRSRPALVEWVNAAMSRVFSRVGAWESASVNFEAAVATRTPDAAASVQHLSFADAEAEALAIAAQIAQLQQGSGDESIAILVRTRPHADAIIAALLAEQVPFVAREFARWTARETIRDLLSLTYAIAHPSDRLALFSVLRSPWVGATLATLAALADHLDRAGASADAWRSLAPDAPWQSGLAADDRERIHVAHRAFAVADARAWLSPLAEKVQASWQSFGGAATCIDDDARGDADAFFAWLDTQAAGGRLPPRHLFERSLDAQRRSFSSNGCTDASGATRPPVEILTIHKAKGLEWDHVFLPGIDRKQRADSRDLAQWRLTSAQDDAEQGRSILIVARDTRKKLEGSVYDYVSQHTRAARSAEVKRLLYVAVTRAKTTLTLTRCNAANAPATDSFSALLGDVAVDGLASVEGAVDKRLRLDKSLTRWKNVPVNVAANEAAVLRTPAYRATVDDAELAIAQSQLDARAEGVVGHLLFEGLAATMNVAPSRGFAPNPAWVRQRLAADGVDASAAGQIAARLVNYFNRAADLDNMKFLFSATHSDVATELTLSDPEQGELRADRTFVTDDGVRWLVDFKFSSPQSDADMADEAARYRPQLRLYADRLTAMDRAQNRNHPITVALYFPWIDTLHCVAL